MTIFVTADHHFGHDRIRAYCDRPFANVREMDQAMIDRWNAVVGPDDTVYHLGDFTLTDSLSPWVHALTFGVLNIVSGGHDWRWMENERLPRSLGAGGTRWMELLPPLFTLELPSGGKRPHVIVLCHYPMLTWDRSHYGSLHLHGHSHGGLGNGLSANGKGRRIDVSVDCWDFAPVALDQLLEETP